ncbi:hypothetical protein STANM309S_02795 [Streptomyces tanashiensis]
MVGIQSAAGYAEGKPLHASWRRSLVAARRGPPGLVPGGPRAVGCAPPRDSLCLDPHPWCSAPVVREP